jgi:hypothetical protein
MISFRGFAHRDLHIARAETLTPNAYSCVALAINCRAAPVVDARDAVARGRCCHAFHSKTGGDRSRSKAAVGIALHDRARGVGVCGRDIPVQLQRPARGDREPHTVKSETGALSPTLVTVPFAVVAAG